MTNDHLTTKAPKTETPKQAAKRYDAIQKQLRKEFKERERERKAKK